ncbi:hypothetical protein EXA16_16530 [Vibrio cincinnatiensis]|uniref:sce7726 family protein n=1 Tax=Vibrio cincinnatiensis TaxID=675 RepID=UPI001EDE5853|nr:sce7726 family protein [Vibrio cincinnatiensis]MCG3737935.1 hypothetical protein [Vibrio cincinnatiensis]
MNDPDIRQLLISRLGKRKSFANEKLLEEVALQNGVIRADVVYCSNKLECFEIKSHNDSLKRLVSQGWQYEQSFDLVTLVCATKHLSPALYMIPEWWGLIEVTKSGSLKSIRRAKSNPNISISGMVDALTNDESKQFLTSIGHGTGISRLSHSQLRTKIQEVATIASLRQWILNTLPKRKATWKPSIRSRLAQELQLVY